MSTATERRTARALLFNAAGSVLLIRFKIVRNGADFVFWATPGGTVESGETDEEAVRREVQEELQATPQLTGPVHRSSDRFTHKGLVVHNTDVFFVGRYDQETPVLSAPMEDEREAMQEARWSSRAQIQATTEIIFPKNLASLIRRFA